MGIMLRDEEEQTDLAARIASEMRSKMSENSSNDGKKPDDFPENSVEDSAYMEKYSSDKKNPYFWRIALLVVILAAVVVGFVVML